MVREVVFDEGGNEVVAVVIPRLQAVVELDAAIRADLHRPQIFSFPLHRNLPRQDCPSIPLAEVLHVV